MKRKTEMDPTVFATVSRRAILTTGVGLGAVAAGGLVGVIPAAIGASGTPALTKPSDKGVLPTGHFPAKAKRVVSIHMWGAVSQVDTFDYKPALDKWHGKEIPPSVKGTAKVSAMTNAQSSFPIMKPFSTFRPYGESGRMVSDLFKYTGEIADELCFIHTVYTPHVNHDPAAIFLHTGFQLAGRPSAGAWVNYALGTDNANLPSYVVLKSQYQPAGVGINSAVWSSGFLPSHHQGVEFRSGTDPVLYVGNPATLTAEDRRAQVDVVSALARDQYHTSGDPEILSKIMQYEMAYRMEQSVPEIADISDEPKYILDMYGPEVHNPKSYARNCLMTRRLIERGVKFVQLHQVGWDHHVRIVQRHPPDCYAVDQPSAALIKDLKQRGLLDDTLVIWGGEFGRTCYAQGGITEYAGRDHHGGNNTIWMAGAGIRPGHAYGETDDFSYNIVKDAVSVHDLHATMLHLLGIDHKQLTYEYLGRNFRLTDVAGEVIEGILS